MADLSSYKDTVSFKMKSLVYNGLYWGFCIALLCPVFAIRSQMW